MGNMSHCEVGLGFNSMPGPVDVVVSYVEAFPSKSKLNSWNPGLYLS